jgi:integrase
LETAEEYQGRRQRRHSGYRNKKTAHKALSDLVAAANRGDYVEPSKQTFGEYLEEWLTTITPTVRPSTLYSYRRNLVLHVKPNIGNVRSCRLCRTAEQSLRPSPSRWSP